jgi:enoyl-[acyl-carrier protein] reductase I
MSFLELENKKVVIFGVANRKSVAFHIAKILSEAGADLLFSIQNEDQKNVINKFFPDAPTYLCDFEDEESMRKCAQDIGETHGPIFGLVHSVAFANFSEGIKPFHETLRKDFLQAVDISCYSFIHLAGLFKPYMDPQGAMLTVSISTTRMAAENYGYMAPIKAALDSSVVFLAKSLSADTKIRVNAVGASLLKTSASAGIPGYIKPYLYAEKATLRKEALKTEEVGNVAAFLLSPRSSGINAQTIVIDAGMSVNYFDREIVDSVID